MSDKQEPCGGRVPCSRFPFCGCGGPDPLPERDTSKPAEAQGLFRKFDVRRTDGSDKPGGKHAGCEYFVLDVDHDPHARAALTAYAEAVKATHPMLAADMRERYGLGAPRVPSLTFTAPEAVDLLEMFGGEAGSVTVRRLAEGQGCPPEDGSTPPAGLYAHYTDYPEEGCIFFGPADEEAPPK
jgi:hypothetical protein